MRAAVKVNEKKEFVLMDVPMPKVKATDVLVKVKTAGLCGTDVAIRNNSFMGRHGPVKTPIIAGHEFCGEVMEVGAGVTRFKGGERVFTTCAVGCGECRNCLTGKTCKNWIHWGIDVDGGFAEYVAVHQDALIAVPDFMPDEHAAIMEIASEANKAVRVQQIRPGSVIVVFGPGPFGQFLLQTMLLTSPVRLIMVGLSSDTERLKIAKELGATDIIIADREDPVEKIFELTNGYGADFTVEATGNVEAVSNAVEALGVGGVLLMAGSGFRGKNVSFKPWNFVRDERRIATVQGFAPEDYQRMLDLYAAGKIRFDPIVSDVRPLSDINQACDLAEAKKVLRVILRP